MVGTLIVILVVVVFMAFFIGKNLSNVCTFWLFHTFSDIQVSVLILLAFAAGIIFSLLALLIYKLKHSSDSSQKQNAETQESNHQENNHQKKEKNKRKGLRNKKSKDDDDKAIQGDEKSDSKENPGEKVGEN